MLSIKACFSLLFRNVTFCVKIGENHLSRGKIPVLNCKSNVPLLVLVNVKKKEVACLYPGRITSFVTICQGILSTSYPDLAKL